MPAPPPGTTSEPLNYLRARPSGEVDSRRVLRFVLVLGVLTLAAVVVATTIGAARQNSAQRRLHRAGVPVEVTVTGCIADSSGVGLHIISYSCHGDYTLDGNRHRALIGGGAFRQVGQTFQGVAVRGDPSLLSTAGAAAKSFSPWTPYITPIILAVITVASAVGLFLWSRSSRRTRPKGTAVSSGAS